VARADEEGHDVRIFGCLSPPNPNDMHPDARPNLRAYACAVAADAWFKRGILLDILVSAIILAMDSHV